jgi:hypothetical protein
MISFWRLFPPSLLSTELSYAKAHSRALQSVTLCCRKRCHFQQGLGRSQNGPCLFPKVLTPFTLLASSVLPKQNERAAHRRSGGLLYLGVHPAWWLTPCGKERLSQSSKRVGPMRVIAGSEALIVQLCAEVAWVDVCDHLPWVSV